MPPTMPVSIMQSLCALCLEHGHLFKEVTDNAMLRQQEAELADVQVQEVNVHTTTDTFLQTIHATEDHAMRAKHTVTLAEWEVELLNFGESFGGEGGSNLTGHLP